MAVVSFFSIIEERYGEPDRLEAAGLAVLAGLPAMGQCVRMCSAGLRIALGFVLVVAVASTALAASAPPRVRVDLLTDVQAVPASGTFWVALRQRIAVAKVVDKAGTLVYAGAIDDKPTSRRSDVQGANNYVREALQSVATGQPVQTPVTRAYGCTVKYA